MKNLLTKFFLYSTILTLGIVFISCTRYESKAEDAVKKKIIADIKKINENISVKFGDIETSKIQLTDIYNKPIDEYDVMVMGNYTLELGDQVRDDIFRYGVHFANGKIVGISKF